MEEVSTKPQTGKALSADGTPLNYMHFRGNSDAPTLVFIHGWGDSLDLWLPHVPVLFPQHSVLLFDLAGHGKSGPGREKWSIAAFAGDVLAACKACAVQRAVLIGHSMGGLIILEAALHAPPLVAGLVPIDIFLDVDKVRSPDEQAAFFRFMDTDYTAAVTALVTSLFPPKPDAQSLQRTLAMELANDPAMMKPALAGAMGSDVHAALRQISAPITATNSDLSTTNIAHARHYTPQFDALVLPGDSHWLMSDRPQEFDQTLLSVLQGYANQPPAQPRI